MASSKHLLHFWESKEEVVMWNNIPIWFLCVALQHSEGYKGSDNEQRVEDVWLEGEQSQTHVGEDEVLRQEVQQLEQLTGRTHTNTHTVNNETETEKFTSLWGKSDEKLSCG